jgi:hypothetical protein
MKLARWRRVKAEEAEAAEVSVAAAVIEVNVAAADVNDGRLLQPVVTQD